MARDSGGETIAGRVRETPSRSKRRKEPNRGPQERRKLRFPGLRVPPGPKSERTMATAVHAQAEKADSVTGEAAGDLPEAHEPTCETGDRTDQPDPARLGELLCGGTLESVLCVYPRLGRKENPAAHDAGKETQGIRLEAMEYGMALYSARAVQRLSSTAI